MKKIRYCIILGIIFIDQGLKYLIRQSMYAGESKAVIDQVFHLTYVQNRGAAFSLFMGREIFLVVLPLCALIFAIWYMEKHKCQHWSLTLSLALVISGGLGNLIDRLFLGFVTDMFDFRIWPVFNVADIAICLGCGLLIIYMFVFDKSTTKEKK